MIPLPFLASQQSPEPDAYGLTVHVVRDFMMKDIDALDKGDVGVSTDRKGGYRVHILKMTRLDFPVIEAQFVFNAAAKSAEAETININSSFYGKGIGLRLMYNALRLCFWLNIPRITFEAGSQMGAYVWAHNGAVIEAQSMFNASVLLNRRIMALKEHMDFRDYYPLRDAAQLRHPDDLRFIAAARQALTRGQVKTALEQLNDKVMAMRLSGNPLLQREKVSVGAFALAGGQYHAHMAVADPVPTVLIRRHIAAKSRAVAGLTP